MEKLKRETNGKHRANNRLKDIRRMRRSDLTSGMIRVIIVYWLVPFLALSAALLYYSESKINSRVQEKVTISLENAAEILRTNISAAVTESKKASYDGVIKKSYTEYQKTHNKTMLYQDVSSYLNNSYKYSSVISSTILIFNEMMTDEYYTYSNVAGSTYADINYFRANALEDVISVAGELGTGYRFVTVGGHVYLVRNIVTSDYTPFAVLVMEINADYLFKSVDGVVWREDWLAYIDGKSAGEFTAVEAEGEIWLEEYAKNNVLGKYKVREDEIRTSYDKDQRIAGLAMNFNKQEFAFVVGLDKEGLLNEKRTLIYAYVIIVLLLIPLMLATFYYFYTNISRPITDLMYASEKIESGEYGYQLAEFNRNQEFRRLFDTFNHMSVSLEESFNRIYAEEVAIRDANMHALQSQINPHFLNNTLEIINWKARMSGSDDVSRMIESLGVMMEATMNRENESFITIRQEMKYVDAYLYIIVQRFGSKFKFEKEIDESLLDIKIPRLIIQPLVENMVDHGGDQYGNRNGKLRIYGDEEYLHIVVENNGKISEKDAARIQKLLHETGLESKERNIGIRNVNLRLRLLYGEQSGLTIFSPKEDLTVSAIVIERRWEKKIMAEQEQKRKNKKNQFL